MSTAKRPRRRQPEAKSVSPEPISKKLKTSTTSHVPTKSGLDFLVDEDARHGRKLEARLTNGVPGAKTSRVDESHALVAPNTRDERETDRPVMNGKAPEIIEISSGEDESSAYESSEDEQGSKPAAEKIPLTNGHISDSDAKFEYQDGDDDEDEDVQLGAGDDRMEVEDGAEQDGEGEDAVEDEDQEPSFGDMLRQRHPGPIDVHAALPENAGEQSAIVSTTNTRALRAPTGTSLGTVLTQALRTNDKDMLESCLQVRDLPSLRATIERLQSPLAATLLERLAERIHKAPGRTGNLMIWIQWTLVTHGGYLSSQPEVMTRLKSLAQVVRERAIGLQPLLHLKGKLDMLSAQLEYRRNLHNASRAANADAEDDEGAVLYVEGRDDDWSEDEDEVMEGDGETRLLEPAPRKSKQQLATPNTDAESEDEDDDESEEDIPNGLAQEVDGDDSEDGGVEEGLFDEEADETSDDDAEEASSDEDASSASDLEDDVSEMSEAESEVEVKAPPPKMLNRKR